MNGNRQSNQKMWADRAAQWKASGLEIDEYVKKSVASAYRTKYRRKLLQVAGAEQAGLTFVRIAKDDAPTVMAPLSVEVTLPGGVIMRIAGARLADVRALAQALSFAAAK